MFYFNSLFCNVNTQTKISVYIMVLNILIGQFIFFTSQNHPGQCAISKFRWDCFKISCFDV